MFSHNTSSIHAGPRVCLTSDPEHEGKGGVPDNPCRDDKGRGPEGVVEGVLMSHFLPDMMGNIRAFSRQKVRCTRCNKSTGGYPDRGV